MKNQVEDAFGKGARDDHDELKVTYHLKRRAALAEVETDDTSLAQAWIATAGGSGKDAELVHGSDGVIRRFHSESGMWSALDETKALCGVSDFLCNVADAKLELAKVKHCAGQIDKKELSAVKSLRKNLRSQARLKAVLQIALIHLKAVEVDAFDAEPELLGTPGGVVDLRTGKTRPATVTDMVTQRTAVKPAIPGTKADKWEQFLSQVFDGDAETIEFFQRLSGSALVGDVSPQKFAVLFGPGANGKSVVRDVLGRTAGSYATTASAKAFMQSSGDRHPTEIASLAAKRMVLASEVPTGRSWNDTLLKDLTGGEKMTARRMHKDEFSFTPCGTVIFTANTLPSFPGAQEAMYRRILLVPMLRQFSEEEQDPNLASKLFAEEGPAILGWMIEGARKFLADGGGVKGLRIPQSIIDATRTYFEEEDIILQFLMEVQNSAASQISWSQGTLLSNKELQAEFSDWAKRNGYAPWTMRSLTKAISENAERYGLCKSRKNSARGFQVERRLAGPPTVDEELRRKHLNLGNIRCRKAVISEPETGDTQDDGQVTNGARK